MKKVLLSVFVAIIFVAYSFQQRRDSPAAVALPVASGQNPKSQSSDDSSDSTSKSSSNSMTTTPATKTYKNGQYTGKAADAFYGNIQVKAIISDGKIIDIVFIQAPNDRQNSIYINSQADPLLKQEAIKAQGAHVDIVSGATDTSTAFIESLTNALNQAI